MSEPSSSTAPLAIEGAGGLVAYVGREIGVSDWVRVDQDTIGRFADATGDRQWIHVDVERAERESPFGGPIAHGFLVLSLAPRLLWDRFTVTHVKAAVNYGVEQVRFLSPVPAGARVRLRAELAELRDHPIGSLAAYDLTFELEGADKPACVARLLTLYAT